MNYRIKKADEHNWVVETFVPEHVAEKGPKMGQKIPARWKRTGYYNNLKNLCKECLDLDIADGYTGKNILEAIEAAEQRVFGHISNVKAEPEAQSRQLDFVPNISAEQATDIMNARNKVEKYLILTNAKRFRRTFLEKQKKLTAEEALVERLKVILESK